MNEVSFFLQSRARVRDEVFSSFSEWEEEEEEGGGVKRTDRS